MNKTASNSGKEANREGEELLRCSNPKCNNRHPSQRFYPNPTTYCSNCGIGVSIANDLERARAWNELQRTRSESPEQPQGVEDTQDSQPVDDVDELLNILHWSSDSNRRDKAHDKIKSLIQQKKEYSFSEMLKEADEVASVLLKTRNEKIKQLETELEELKEKEKVQRGNADDWRKRYGELYDNMNNQNCELRADLAEARGKVKEWEEANQELVNAIDSMAYELEKYRWIPVSERLPDYDSRAGSVWSNSLDISVWHKENNFGFVIEHAQYNLKDGYWIYQNGDRLESPYEVIAHKLHIRPKPYIPPESGEGEGGEDGQRF